jgi:hypothetical protein
MVDYEVVNDVLYYSVPENYAPEITKIYRSDGTPCGTFSVNTGVPGGTPMEAVNNKLIFAGVGNNVGVEPHAYNTATAPVSPCGATMARTSEQTLDSGDPVLTTWPNPFTAEFTMQFQGTVDEYADVAVFTGTGFPLETHRGLPSNTPNILGRTWPPGMYIVKISRAGALTTHMIIKK